MPYDGEIKSRASSSIDKSLHSDVAVRISDDTGVDTNASTIRNIKHRDHNEEHDPNCEICRDYITPYPNRWSRYREVLREPAAEMLGTMIMILFGNGVDCQVVLGGNTNVSASERGNYLSLNFGWACGAALGVWMSGGISGGHINPVVTLSLAVFRDFPWKKVPAYIFAQFLGAWIGAMLVFADYFHAIDISLGRTTPGTASLFATYALDYVPSANAFFDQFLGTFILMLVVLSVTDKRNGPPPPGMVPLVIFIVILGIGAAFGMQTGYAINPARDLGPRVMTAMMGYGRSVFTFRDQYWLWAPIIAPVCGGLVATFVYDSLIFLGSESILNRPNAEARRLHARAAHAERKTPYPGLGVARDKDSSDMV